MSRLRRVGLPLVVLLLSACSVTVSGGPSGGGGPVAQTPTASLPSPSPEVYGLCQLMVNGSNARVTVGGPGVSSGVCTGLLTSLGTQFGWTSSAAPPPSLPTTDVICAVPQSLLPANDQGVVTDSGFFSTTIGSAACSALAAASLQGPCPPPITGQISGPGNRIPLQIEISGPEGTVKENAILDTGGIDELLPDTDLRSAGFSPSGRATASVGGWSGVVNVYALPAADLLVLDAATYVPLATGTLTVEGVPSSVFSGGLSPLIGPNVLQQGARLRTAGAQFALTPACS